MDFETILKMTQPALKDALARELKKSGYSQVRNPKGFVYAPGTVPVLLVAHLDTVHRQPVKNILYSKDGSLMMSPEGIGGDDRAGVYAILQIIKQNQCHVLFCEDEEIGGRGANSFARSKIRPKVNYIVELDRRGANDAVFYSCDNDAFTDFVCGFGFDKAHGTFSDISIIAPHLGVAAVNISAGYYNEHTRHEYISIADLQNNIERVNKMVSTPTDCFEYVERTYYGGFEQMDYTPARTWRTEWETYSQTKSLMPLPDSSYIKVNGRIAQPRDTHYIDEDGKVYNYLFDLDAAVLSDNTTAFSVSGLYLRFDYKLSRKINVITYETALEKMNIGA